MKTLFYILLASFLISSSTVLRAQSNIKNLSLEITPFKVGINVGPYRGRTPETDGPFNQGTAGFGQVYFPFKVSVGKNDTAASKEYSNKTLLLRPSIIIHLIDNGALAYGGAIQLSFRTIKQFYLEYQLGIVYLEANEGASPDLYDGINLHHFVSLSKPLSNHFSASIGFVHLSKGAFDSKTSNQDLITLGIKYNL